jgi:hemolysin III
MTRWIGSERAYSRAEILSDGVVHLIGLAFAAVATPALIWAAVVWHGDWMTVTATAIYAISLLLMLGFSALYNMTPGSPWVALYKRLDHSAIYVKIAGTYTPLLLMSGAPAGPLLTGIWAAALGGVGLKIAAPDRLRWLGLVLYLGIGWAGVALGQEAFDGLGPVAVGLIVAGGLLYTGGVAFFLWERLQFHNTIWHVFVLAASACIYGAVFSELAA